MFHIKLFFVLEYKYFILYVLCLNFLEDRRYPQCEQFVYNSMYVILFGPLEFKLNCTIRIRIADVFRIPLSLFSSHRSHNCKREGNYNLLSMILQIDIPFPSLMNALLLYDFFSHFPNIYKIFCYFVSFFLYIVYVL